MWDLGEWYPELKIGYKPGLGKKFQVSDPL